MARVPSGCLVAARGDGRPAQGSQLPLAEPVVAIALLHHPP